MAMEDWDRRWDALRRACMAHGARLPPHRKGFNSEPLFERAPPASDVEVRSVEAELAIPIPVSFSKVLTGFSAAVDLAWQLPAGVRTPAPCDGIFSGQLYWDLRQLPEIEQKRSSYVESCFPDPGDAYDRVWHDKLAFAEVPNGDLVAIDLSAAEEQPVVYLSHDDGEGHGVRLGGSFEDFVDRFLRIGCPGLEDWQWLPFVTDAESGIDPACPNAALWRRWFRLEAGD